ncbi:MAG TPA: LacI family DNA-binding transcriptional regulator [Clostridiaceae bacterium]
MGSITIKDVAKHAGVSIATVSRVINKNYYVSHGIEVKVSNAIKELGYYPNSVARSLKNDTTHSIGFVVSDISNNHYTRIAKALEKVIEDEKYNIIVCSTENKKEREKALIELLMSKKVDGLIINTTGKNSDFISQISNNVNVILINRKIKGISFKGDFIDSNNSEGGYTLVSHLLSLGHRKIAVINGNLELSTGLERYEGFKKAMQETGLNVENNYKYRYDGDFSTESGYQGMAKIMSLSDKPTAIVVMNNSMAIGALRYFKSHQINVPQDISIVSYGDIDNIDLLYIQPSIVTLNAQIIGSKAGEMLLERIKDKSIINREVIYTPKLVIGNGVQNI